MNVGLKSVKISQHLSQETTAFSATVTLDGKNIGTVRNDGHGGSHVYLWDDRQAGIALEEWAATQELEFKFEKLDQIVDRLLQAHEQGRVKKRLAKLCQKEVLFRLKGDQAGRWRSLAMSYGPKVRKQLDDQYGGRLECVANDDLDRAATFC